MAKKDYIKLYDKYHKLASATCWETDKEVADAIKAVEALPLEAQPRKLKFELAKRVNKDAFKAETAEIMRAQGAEEHYIKEVLTDAMVENALVNKITAEDLAWGLLF